MRSRPPIAKKFSTIKEIMTAVKAIKVPQIPLKKSLLQTYFVDQFKNIIFVTQCDGDTNSFAEVREKLKEKFAGKKCTKVKIEVENYLMLRPKVGKTDLLTIFYSF